MAVEEYARQQWQMAFCSIELIKPVQAKPGDCGGLGYKVKGDESPL